MGVVSMRALEQMRRTSTDRHEGGRAMAGSGARAMTRASAQEGATGGRLLPFELLDEGGGSPRAMSLGA